MKRKTAKEILAESFREIAEKKPISKITVRDITDNCGYSPATFYRHFNDKYDLITYDYSTHIESIIAKTGTDGYQLLLCNARCISHHSPPGILRAYHR